MPYPAKTDREAILAAAMQQVERHGAEKLAIRSVAAALGLAPNALYRYFASLAALEAALAEESRRRLLTVMQRAAERKRPAEAIRGICDAYVRFAREHPQIFSLTLKPSNNDGDENAVHLQSWRFVLEQVGRLYGDKRAPEAAVALWALLHGMTVLERAGVLSEMKPSSGLAFGLQMWIGGASAGSNITRA
ncbi:MAG: TetR/AcrR family transcriptional regulator [Nevskia sp.]|nr:TetR/AcrR family transcriptional regulator [Nevskia sp.]